MAWHKIVSVKPSGELTFDAFFQGGECRRYDVRPLFDRWPAFRALRDVPGLFALVRVEAGGYGVAWNDNLDLESEDIWEFGTVPTA